MMRGGFADNRASKKGRLIIWCSSPVAAFPESYIESGYEQHCLGTPNSGRSYARRAHASRSCPRSWMSPSVGSILGEQGQQPADQCRLHTRQHRTGAHWLWRDSIFDTNARSPIALIELLFAAEGQIADVGWPA